CQTATGFVPATFARARIISYSRLIPGKTTTADFMDFAAMRVRFRNSRSPYWREASGTWLRPLPWRPFDPDLGRRARYTYLAGHARLPENQVYGARLRSPCPAGRAR